MNSVLKNKAKVVHSLFRWCTTPYSCDIHNYLKEKDGKRGHLLFRSPQEKYRNNLIEWLRSISEKLKLSHVTVHLAVRLIDNFMDDHNISENRLAAVCLVCLLLAAKYEEEDSSVPKMKDLPNLVSGETSKAEFVALELFVLKSFDWDVSMVTAAHFAEYYILFSIVKGDSDDYGTGHYRLQNKVQVSMKDFLDVSLTDVYMNEFSSSEVAAASLLAARLEHRIHPPWPHYISQVTGYTLSDLQRCLDALIQVNKRYCDQKKTAELPYESGYESGSPENLRKKRKISFKEYIYKCRNNIQK